MPDPEKGTGIVFFYKNKKNFINQIENNYMYDNENGYQ